MVTGTSADLFQGLADPTRWRIVQRLSSGGLSVAEIAAEFPMSRPAVSKHLRVLRLAGLVVERKEGRRRIYELVAEPLEQVAVRLDRLASGSGAQRGLAVSTGLSDAGATVRGSRRRRDAEPARDDADAGALGEEREWRSW